MNVNFLLISGILSLPNSQFPTTGASTGQESVPGLQPGQSNAGVGPEYFNRMAEMFEKWHNSMQMGGGQSTGAGMGSSIPSSAGGGPRTSTTPSAGGSSAGPRPSKNEYGAPSESRGNHGACLQVHNQARQEKGLTPLTWSSSLSASAEKYAKILQQKSPNALNLVHSQWPGIGENLYAITDITQATCVNAAKVWVAEKPLYAPGTPIGQGDFHGYGHYTQIVTPKGTQVGCNADSGAGFYMVCHYDAAQVSGSIV